MRLWRHIGRQQWAKTAIGIGAAEYLRLVGGTTRFVLEPADIYERGEADMPIILAFWHGQHLLAPVARKTRHRVYMLVSRHRDGLVAGRTLQREHRLRAKRGAPGAFLDGRRDGLAALAHRGLPEWARHHSLETQSTMLSPIAPPSPRSQSAKTPTPTSSTSSPMRAADAITSPCGTRIFRR